MNIIRRLSEILHDVNPFISIYKTARERLQETEMNRTASRIIFNPQLRLVVEQGADRRRENLPTSDEVALIIPDEYGDRCFRDICLAYRSGPEAQDGDRLHRISQTHAAYMPLHYVLLFPSGDLG